MLTPIENRFIGGEAKNLDWFTPPPLIQAGKEPSLQEALTKGCLIIEILDPKQFGQFLTTEYDRWGATVKAAGIKAD